MMNECYYLIAFPGTHAAMAAEAFLGEVQVRAKLIPLPSIIAAGCGFAIKLATNDVEAARPFLKQGAFESASFYRMTKENGEIIADDWVI